MKPSRLSPDRRRPVEQTLQDTLLAQLEVLQFLFPLSSWQLVAQNHQRTAILAAWPGLTPVPEGVLGSPDWRFSARLHGFECLPGAAVTSAGGISHFLRYRLTGAPDDAIRVWLLGQAATEEGPASGRSPAPMPAGIAPLLRALGLSISLHQQLEAQAARLGELKRSAFTDLLTGVLNRAGWMNRTEHLEALLMRSNENLAIFMLDLDKLKAVNDSRGHSAGDALLQRTARIICSILRPGDVVGRLGGDEFGVVIKGVSREGAQSLKQRLALALQAEGVEVSIGMALRSEADSLEEAVGLADERMYAHKQSRAVPSRLS